MPTSESRSQLLTDILTRAAQDRTFRVALLDEPKSAIYGAFGMQVPAAYRIRFIERGPDVDSLIVLPDLKAEGELTDDELEEVAGGTTPPPPPPDPLTWLI